MTSLPVTDRISTLKASLQEMGVFETAKGPVKFYGRDGAALVETPEWRLWAAELPEPKGQFGLLMIATDPKFNEVLEWQSFTLSILQDVADELNASAKLAEFAPNYGANFARVLASIDADGRKALILSYHPSILAYNDLKPLTLIPAGKRIDLKSSVWILGKFLKMLAFMNQCDFALGKVTLDNLFITMDNVDIHGVFALDFTFVEENPSVDTMKAEIASLAKIVWSITGGTDTSEPPFDADIMTIEQHAEFVAFLKRLADGNASDADTEMTALYELNDRIWPKVAIEGGPNSRGQTHKRQWHVLRFLDK